MKKKKVDKKKLEMIVVYKDDDEDVQAKIACIYCIYIIFSSYLNLYVIRFCIWSWFICLINTLLKCIGRVLSCAQWVVTCEEENDVDFTHTCIL